MLVACQVLAKEHGMRIHQLTPAEIAQVEQGVRDALKDPDSAKFSSLTGSVSETGTVAACGLVNAKNSFGGYTGKAPFMGLIMVGTYETKFVVVSMGSDDDEQQVTRMMCERNQIVLP